MLQASLQKSDKKAYWLIGVFSAIVFVVLAGLGSVKMNIHTDFDVHIFAKVNAVINTLVAIMLITALAAVKSGNYELHKKVMITAMILSILFLLSYITHHLLAGEAKFGDINHDGIVSTDEKLQVHNVRIIYLLLLATHILLATFILPFILFTAYRALIAEWPAHKKLAKYTWPLWLYVSVTGPIIYLMIRPYYH